MHQTQICQIKTETRAQRENAAVLDDRDHLAVRVDDLTEALGKRDKELVELHDQLQRLLAEKTTAINEMESEMRAKERLAELYKGTADAAQTEIAALRDTENRLQTLLQENDIGIFYICFDFIRNLEMKKQGGTQKPKI
jgi:regulator of replication initiation timing